MPTSLKSVTARGAQAIGATLVRAVCGLAVQKLMAMWFGPVGITLLNHVQNLTATFISLPNDGLNRGLTALYPTAKVAGAETTLARTALGISLGIYGLSLLSLALFPTELVEPFTRDYGMATWLWWFVPSLLGYFLFSYWCGIQLAEGKVAKYSYMQSLTALVALAVAGIGLMQGKASAALIGFVAGQGLGGLISWLHDLKTPGPIVTPKPDETSAENITHLSTSHWAKQLMGFVGMAAGIMLFGRLGDLLVRAYAIRNFNELDVGYWQAVARLGEAYLLPLNTFLTAVVFPGLAAYGGRGPEAWKQLTRSMTIGLPINWIGLVLCYFLGADLLVWLNDIEFRAASPLLPWQLMGDALRFPAFFFATMMLARNKPWHYLSLEGISLVAYLVALAWLLPLYDIRGFVMAHVVRSAIYLVATIMMTTMDKAAASKS